MPSAETVPFDPWREWWAGSPFAVNLASGAAAGAAVDVVLFPLDSIKTRLQSPLGFAASGGFRRLYAGVTISLAGSVPCSAIFFATFEAAQPMCGTLVPPPDDLRLGTAASAALGELAASVVRAPVELLKTRRQVGQRALAGAPASAGGFADSAGGGSSSSTSGAAAYSAHASASNAAPRALFAARHHERVLALSWAATAMRDVPFAVIQYPLYAHLKRYYIQHMAAGGSPRPAGATPALGPGDAAVCGAVSGAIAAFLTTPLDAIQTRVMLSGGVSGEGLWRCLPTLRQMWAGAIPRTLWMGLGGFIYLGTFEQAKSLFGPHHEPARGRECQAQGGGAA